MPNLELTHVWKDQSGNVVAELYGGVSLIPEIAKRQERIDELMDDLARAQNVIDAYDKNAVPVPGVPNMSVPMSDHAREMFDAMRLALEAINTTLSTPGDSWQVAGIIARDVARTALNR